MSIQFSTDLRNGQNDQITTKIGANGLLDIFTGSPPGSCDSADSGTKLVEFICNATFAPSSTSGSITINPYTSVTALASGTAGYFRFKTSGGAQKVQGTVTASGGGGDLTLDNTSINSGQLVSMNTQTITAGGA